MAMKIGNRTFETTGKTYVMGILNVTPDSFSDGGKWNHLDSALHHVEEMLKDGMDIVDIGGESTRPGYTLLPDQQEIDRVVPVIEAVKARFDVPISLDTYKSQVAKAGLAAGADLINDIWGLKYDPQLAKIIGDAKVPCCLMHNRTQPNYNIYLTDLVSDLEETLALAQKGGISKSQIILDPGVGFGKTYENNLEIINHLEVLDKLGCPILLGTSRKSVVGLTLDLPANERVEGTLVTTVFGVLKGCMFVRVHDVKENARAILMTESILQGRKVNKS
jgi:dihydropteroate synthase